MKTLAFGVSASIVLGVAAQAQIEPPELPPTHMLLVQSELDYLAGVDRPLTVEWNDALPQVVLTRIGKLAGVTVEVEGKLPSEPRLTGSFESRSVKEVLTWFAGKVPVVYKVKRSDTLIVVVRDRRQP